VERGPLTEPCGAMLMLMEGRGRGYSTIHHRWDGDGRPAGWIMEQSVLFFLVALQVFTHQQISKVR
jgi:hypothetical protein